MRYMTAGESHGPELTAIIEGLPAGLPLSEEEINHELARHPSSSAVTSLSASEFVIDFFF